MESAGMKKPLIFAFHVEILPDALETAEKQGVKIFKSDIIYKLIEDHQKWEEEEKKSRETRLLESVTHPGKMKILPGYVFRQSKPAIFGVEILGGIVKPGYKLRKGEKVIGEVKELQSEGDNVEKAKAGEKVAVSIDGVTIGRQISEGDTLENVMKEKDFEVLKKLKAKLPDDERKLLEEFEGKEKK